MELIPALITVRYASSRLPGKCLLPFGDSTVLGHCVQRALKASFRPIICTSTESSDDAVIKEAIDLNVEYFRGDLLNKIKRWNSCMKHFGLKSTHVIDGDDPFFDTDEIRNSFEIFRSRNLELMLTSERSDSGFASLGLSLTSSFADELTSRSIKLKTQNLDVIPWNLLLNSNDKWIRAHNNYVLGENGSEIFRLTLDYEEDYDFLNMLATKFGPNVNRYELEHFLFNEFLPY
jgi:spore coat polysaccharide biosynthesis protein SpsF